MPAPILTPAQFARTPTAKKPGASYRSYVNWVTRTRASRAAAKAANPLAGFRSALTNAPALARGDVNVQIKAALAGERASTRLAQQQANAQAEQAQGFAGALAKMTEQDPKAVGDIYRQAADRVRLFGTGLTGTVGEAMKAEADRSAANVAQVTGGLGQVTGLDREGLMNASQYGGVTIPGTSLEGQAANAEAAAQGSRATDVYRIGQIANEYRKKTTDLQAELAAKRAALEGTRPDLYRKAIADRQAEARNNLATLINASYLQNTIRQTGATITGVDPVTGKPTASTKEKTGPDSSWSNTNGYISDGQGRPIYKNGKLQVLPGFTVKNGRVVKTSTGDPVGRAPDSTLSGKLGFLVDAQGRPIKNKDGSLRVLPGFTFRNGRVVKAGTGGGSDITKNMSPKQVSDLRIQVADTIKKAFYGVKNPNYKEGSTDPKTRDEFLNKPREASDVLRDLRNVAPYDMIYPIMRRYASSPGSTWDYVLDWQNPSRKKKKKKKT